MTGIYVNISKEFFIDEQLLRKISDVVSTHIGKLPYETVTKFKIYKSDDTFNICDSCDDVLKDDNSPRKKIIRVVIEVYNKELVDKADASEIFSLDLDKVHECRIHFEINEKDRDWSFLFLDDLSNQISRITRGEFWVKIQERWIQTILYLVCSAILSSIFYVYVPISIFFEGQNDDAFLNYHQLLFQQTRLIVTLFILVFSLMLLSLLKPINNLAEWAGESVFYWGDESSRYDKARSLRKNLFWIILVGFSVSIGASLLVLFVFN